MSHFSSDIQHHSQPRLLQNYETAEKATNYYYIYVIVCVGVFVLAVVGGIILRIRARRRRVVRSTPQNLAMTPNAGFQLSSSVSPQSYGQSYGQPYYGQAAYPNQEQANYYPNVNYPGYQNGMDPNNPYNTYGMQPGYPQQQNAYPVSYNGGGYAYA